MVKYDTIVELPSVPGLRPGMSAEVEVILSEHEDVLTIPVAAVIETETESLCWVQIDGAVERRVLELGESNDVFIVVRSGLVEGDEVVLNPRAYVEEAKEESLKTIDEASGEDAEVEQSPQKAGNASAASSGGGSE